MMEPEKRSYSIRVRGSTVTLTDVPREQVHRAGNTVEEKLGVRNPFSASVDATSPDAAVRWLLDGQLDPDLAPVDEIWVSEGDHSWVFDAEGKLTKEGPTARLLEELSD